MVKIEHQISVTVRVYGPLKSYLPLLKQEFPREKKKMCS